MSDKFVSIVWIMYSIGVRNMKLNLIGLVMLVRNDVSVIENSRLLIIVWCFFGVLCSIVRYVVGRLNIMIGKKLVMKVFVVGLFVKKWCRLLCMILLLVGGVKLLNMNYVSELMMWCRLVMSSRWFRKLNMNVLIVFVVVSYWLVVLIVCWIGCYMYLNVMFSIM